MPEFVVESTSVNHLKISVNVYVPTAEIWKKLIATKHIHISEQLEVYCDTNDLLSKNLFSGNSN
jgi:hypothetical protein